MGDFDSNCTDWGTKCDDNIDTCVGAGFDPLIACEELPKGCTECAKGEEDSEAGIAAVALSGMAIIRVGCWKEYGLEDMDFVYAIDGKAANVKRFSRIGALRAKRDVALMLARSSPDGAKKLTIIIPKR